MTGFDWDDGNSGKCRKHGVTIDDIESLFHRPIAVFPDPAHSKGEERFKAIGKNDKGRHILIVFTLRQRKGETLIRPISARYMRQNEVDYYEEETAKARHR